MKLLSKKTLPGFNNKNIFFRKIFNTFFQMHFLWRFNWIVSDAAFDKMMRGDVVVGPLKRVLFSIFWFLPRIYDANSWVKGHHGGLKDPSHFTVNTQLDVDVIDLIDDVLEDRSLSLLDLGCNSGRHLSLFHALGYTNLNGFEAMGAALAEFQQRFPAAYAATKLHHGLWQQLLRNTPDSYYDTVFTWGATIETVHPSYPIVAEMCRVAKQYAVCVINEHGHRPRLWVYEFSRSGFDLVYAIRPLRIGSDSDHSVTSLLIFRRAEP